MGRKQASFLLTWAPFYGKRNRTQRLELRDMVKKFPGLRSNQKIFIPFHKLGLTCGSVRKSLGPRGPPLLEIGPLGAAHRDKPGRFHHFLPPARAGAAIGCPTQSDHCGLSQDSSGRERGAPPAGLKGKRPSSPQDHLPLCGPLAGEAVGPGRAGRGEASRQVQLLSLLGAGARAGVRPETPGPWLSQDSSVYSTNVHRKLVFTRGNSPH